MYAYHNTVTVLTRKCCEISANIWTIHIIIMDMCMKIFLGSLFTRSNGCIIYLHRVRARNPPVSRCVWQLLHFIALSFEHKNHQSECLVYKLALNALIKRSHVFYSVAPAVIDEDVLRYQRVKEKAYVRLMTSKGPLNLELHCDMVNAPCMTS